jgi:hypothetical protein
MIKIRKGTIDEVLEINKKIKEFDYHFPKEYFESILMGKDYLIAIALVDGNLAGFQISWLDKINGWVQVWVAGVLPNYRGVGVLKNMEDFRNKWAKKLGFHRVKSDVNNKMRDMLVASVKLGYSIVGVELHGDIDKCRVFFEKRI